VDLALRDRRVASCAFATAIQPLAQTRRGQRKGADAVVTPAQSIRGPVHVSPNQLARNHLRLSVTPQAQFVHNLPSMVRHARDQSRMLPRRDESRRPWGRRSEEARSWPGPS